MEVRPEAQENVTWAQGQLAGCWPGRWAEDAGRQERDSYLDAQVSAQGLTPPPDTSKVPRVMAE